MRHAPLADRLASRLASANNAPTPLTIVLVEHQDSDGRRWVRALELLLEARVKAGLQRARARGVRLGRPTAAVEPSQLRSLQREGLSLGEIARRLQCSRSTIRRRLLEVPPQPVPDDVIGARRATTP